MKTNDLVKKAKIKSKKKYGQGRPKKQGNDFYNNKMSPSPIRNKTYNIFYKYMYIFMFVYVC